jgi:hypothetical protein
MLHNLSADLTHTEQDAYGLLDAGDYEDIGFGERMEMLSEEYIADFFDNSEIVDARYRNAR